MDVELQRAMSIGRFYNIIPIGIGFRWGYRRSERVGIRGAERMRQNCFRMTWDDARTQELLGRRWDVVVIADDEG